MPTSSQQQYASIFLPTKEGVRGKALLRISIELKAILEQVTLGASRRGFGVAWAVTLSSTSLRYGVREKYFLC